MSTETIAGELGEDLVLRGLQEAPVPLDPEGEFAPAQWLVHEWRDYAIEWTEAASSRPPIELSGLPSSQWRQVGGAAEFEFANQLGLARLVVRAGGAEVPLTLEVLSPKFPTAAAHRAFYDPLVRQLTEQAASLPYTLEAPTAIRTVESMRPRSDLFAWHFLRQEGNGLLSALRLVLNQPRRLLTVVEHVVGLEQAISFDEGTVLEIARRPERLMRVPDTAEAWHWPLARRLQQVQSGRRFLPRELTTVRAEETLDTPEHRFVRAFLEELANTADRLLTRRNLPADGQRYVRSLSGEIHDALGATFLSEVGPLGAFPWTSRILQRADGYRDLLQAWRKFQLAQDPFQSLDQALDARDVATLYEWWCFFALVQRIAKLKSFRSISARFEDIEGLPHRLQASFDAGWTLAFNRCFPPGPGAWQSYSLRLCPDFILARDNVPLVALDAKFRFDATDWQLIEQSSDVASAADGEETTVSAQRLVKEADIYKIHTYRDALGLRCCAVVYPGSGRDEAAFYQPDGRKSTGWSLNLLLDEPTPMGVGSIPMSPEHFNRA